MKTIKIQQNTVSLTAGERETLNSKLASKLLSKLVILLLVLIVGNTTFANNLAISNLSLNGQNTTSHYTNVQFDISWDNSWRVNTGPSNWDAAWVFVKYRLKNQTTWNHATLHYVDGTGSGDGHTEPTNTNISSANDNGSGGSYGVFIHRDADMVQGSVSYTGVKLRWDYGVDGLADGDDVELFVYGIEMVYVPQGSFELGSGGTETNHFYKYPTSTSTYTVGSENAITVGTTADNLHYEADVNGGDQAGPIPAAFPKGYSAFYCMKYEISQEQYVVFLNKLTFTQDATRFPNENGNRRHSITGTSRARTTSKPYVACNYISFDDLAAYLDWVALRPMTELEYEKACRGTEAPVVKEYAWGSASIVALGDYEISNDGANNEGITTNYSTTAGNAIYSQNSGAISGPVRCGIFAANGSNTDRETAGATFYGIMEMTGNVAELAITVGNATGRLFTGTNGDGALSSAGNANTANWPSAAAGSGVRGGNWSYNTYHAHVSARVHAARVNNRLANNGGRGVRLAP